MKNKKIETEVVAISNHIDDDFFVLIWSLDCPPCLEEMPTISTIHQQNPELKIIMISADDASRHNEVQQVIANYKLSNLQHWVFEDSENMAIRYSIDRSWYGELPRSYLFQKGQRIQSYSGQLEMPHFKDWLSQINTK